MKVKLNPAIPWAEYQFDKSTRITHEWQTVTKTKAKAMLLSRFEGRPLVITDESPARKADEDDPAES